MKRRGVAMVRSYWRLGCALRPKHVRIWGDTASVYGLLGDGGLVVEDQAHMIRPRPVVQGQAGGAICSLMRMPTRMLRSGGHSFVSSGVTGWRPGCRCGHGWSLTGSWTAARACIWRVEAFDPRPRRRAAERREEPGGAAWGGLTQGRAITPPGYYS